MLGEQFNRLASSQSCSDIQAAYLEYGKAFKEIETQRGEIANFYVREMIEPLGKSLSVDKKELSDLISKASAKEKASKSAVEKCESLTKKAKKDPEKLKEAIKNLDEKVKEQEAVLQSNLRELMVFQRKKYCDLASHLEMLMAPLLVLGRAEQDLVEKHQVKMSKLGLAEKSLPDTIETLTTKRVRTFQKLNITSDWKKVFKDAGVKKSDLADEETAQLILQTIENATGQKINLPTDEEFIHGGFEEEPPALPARKQRAAAPLPVEQPEGQQQAKDEESRGDEREGETADGVEGAAEPSANFPPASPDQEPSSTPPQLPPRASNNNANTNNEADGNAEESGDGTNEEQPQQTETIPEAPPFPCDDASTIPPAPSAPPAPSTPSTPSQSQNAPPLPSRSRADLLSEIQKGTTLRHTNQVDLPKLETAEKVNDMTSLLRSAIATRRVAVVDDPETDSDEWTD